MPLSAGGAALKSNLGDVAKILGALLGTLSVVKLAQHAFEAGLGPALRIVAGYYENLVRALLGWAEPCIKEQLARMGEYLGWNLHLYPHWRHIFVLLGIYVFRDVASAFGFPYRGTAYFRLVFGPPLALAASIGAGSVPPQSGVWWNFFEAALPILALALYELGYWAWAATTFRKTHARLRRMVVPTWWAYFRTGLYYASRNTAVAMILLLAGLQIPFVGALPDPGLAMLGFLIVLYAAHMILVAVREVKTLSAARLRQVDSWLLGSAIISTFLGAGLFFILNAGLGLVGL